MIKSVAIETIAIDSNKFQVMSFEYLFVFLHDDWLKVNESSLNPHCHGRNLQLNSERP